MREVIVLVGPRASGKSIFSDKVLALEPSTVLVSRDKVLTDLYGNDWLDPYTGCQQVGEKRMWELIKERLASSPNIRLIFDVWNGFSSERRYINRTLRNLGAERVDAWLFVTPVEQVCEWFWMKPGIAKMSEMATRQGEGLSFYSEDAPFRDYNFFFDFAVDIDLDGFDSIIKVNPLIMGPEHVLKLQTSLEI